MAISVEKSKVLAVGDGEVTAPICLNDQTLEGWTLLLTSIGSSVLTSLERSVQKWTSESKKGTEYTKCGIRRCYGVQT